MVSDHKLVVIPVARSAVVDLQVTVLRPQLRAVGRGETADSLKKSIIKKNWEIS